MFPVSIANLVYLNSSLAGSWVVCLLLLNQTVAEAFYLSIQFLSFIWCVRRGNYTLIPTHLNLVKSCPRNVLNAEIHIFKEILFAKNKKTSTRIYSLDSRFQWNHPLEFE